MLLVHTSDQLPAELWEKSGKSFKWVVRGAKADRQWLTPEWAAPAEALEPWNHCNMRVSCWCLHVLLLSKWTDKPSFCKTSVLNIGKCTCFSEQKKEASHMEAASFPPKQSRALQVCIWPLGRQVHLLGWSTVLNTDGQKWRKKLNFVLKFCFLYINIVYSLLLEKKKHKNAWHYFLKFTSFWCISGGRRND